MNRQKEMGLKKMFVHEFINKRRPHDKLNSHLSSIKYSQKIATDVLIKPIAMKNYMTAKNSFLNHSFKSGLFDFNSIHHKQ